MTRHAALVVVGLLLATRGAPAEEPKALADGPPLPGTARLEMQGDIASQLVEGADRFLLDRIAKSVAGREKFWHRDFSSPEKYAASIEPNRKRLAQILGVRDAKLPFMKDEFSCAANWSHGDVVGSSDSCLVLRVRWSAFGDVAAEGLLLRPMVNSKTSAGGKAKQNAQILGCVVAIPDAGQTPEMLAGVVSDLAPQAQYARRLAESGFLVVVPTLVSREMRKVRSARVTNREFIYRQAFEMGRHLLGYELEKVPAAIDVLPKLALDVLPKPAGEIDRLDRVGVIGWGEGGLLALYAAALDPRINVACVSGYFGPREGLWRETLDRNLFGLLEQFGDAEAASLIAPRTLIVEAARGVEFTVPPGTGGGPGVLTTPRLEEVCREVQRARELVAPLKPAPRIELVARGDGTGSGLSEAALKAFVAAVNPAAKLAHPRELGWIDSSYFDVQGRQDRTVYELERYTQRLIVEGPEVRKKFFAKLDVSSLDKFQKTVEPYREFFYNEVIGRFDLPLLPPNARTRQAYDAPKWTGYEVVLDVFPELIAYGVLLVPKDLKTHERRPVVVCQHGLEGRPQDVIEKGPGYKYYSGFAAALADQGFVTFAPQNLYIFQDRFRTLQRKANPLKKTLFSLIVPQHQQITNWLGTLPFVDKTRIAFYGLSYGGKSAMRIPPLVKNYCLSICSGDFNRWVWKNASTLAPCSYMGTGEYEIFEFDLGSTFDYAEMAALIAPRPFMVERGHFDGCAPDEAVGYEFAKVRFLYEAKLGIGDRCELEWFNGPHMIHSQGTYRFLHQHLDWPPRGN
jgi:dienelactone hydrolase